MTIVPTADSAILDAVDDSTDVIFTLTDRVTDTNAGDREGGGDDPVPDTAEFVASAAVTVNPIAAGDTLLGLTAPAAVDEGGEITLTLSGSFADVDGSESHALSIPVPAGWSIVGTDSDWTQDPLTGVLVAEP